MSTGRNNTRRRRVILDDAVQATADESNALGLRVRSSSTGSKAYSHAAKRRGQLKTTDLIPKRWWAVSLVVIGILVTIVLINWVAISSSRWTILNLESLNTLRISGIGSFSNWFSSILFLVTGLASLQIYAMRRHRCDDYSGHYRIWLWLAVLFALASINFVVELRSLILDLSRWAGLAGDNNYVVFLVAKMVALTGLVVRGILEIRASKAAFAAVAVVWIAYAATIVIQVPTVEIQFVNYHEMVVGNLTLIGNMSLFLAIVLYARFVYLHANDLIAAKKPRTKQQPSKPKIRTKRRRPLDGDVQDSGSAVSNQTPANPRTSKPILSLTKNQHQEQSDRQRGKKSNKQRRRAA